MIDEIGRIKRLEENIATLAQYLVDHPCIGSEPPEGQSQVSNIYWDNDLQRVVVEKQQEE